LVKKNQQMEEQLGAFAGSTAGSILIAVGLGVYAFPYAVKYLVKNAEEQAIPWALGLGKEFYDEYTGTIKAALKKLEAQTWHEANPDATTEDIDIPAVSGDPYTAYLKIAGLPASTVLLAFGDKESLAIYEHSGEWHYYSTRKINGNHYYVLVPKGINVYITFDRKVYDADSYPEKCQPQPDWWATDPDCWKKEKESILMRPHVWP
jgi:hypothetical protein